jgi:serine/threonine-protein kinase
MSPEQAMGEHEPDGRSDIYSLGAVAYYLLTAVPPFNGDKPIKVIMAHVQQEVAPLSQHRADIPRDLERIVLKCLAKNPADRYQTADELAAALAEVSGVGTWTREDAAAWWQTNGDQGLPGLTLSREVQMA